MIIRLVLVVHPNTYRLLSSLIEVKGKNVEVNFVYQDDVYDPSNMTRLDVPDFF